MIVLRCRIYINLLFYVALKFPRFVAISLKSQVSPQIQNSQTVEAVNINKSVSQSEKAIPAGFWRRNIAVSIWLQKPGDGKNLTPDARQTVWHTLQNLASNFWRQFLERVSSAISKFYNVMSGLIYRAVSWWSDIVLWASSVISSHRHTPSSDSVCSAVCWFCLTCCLYFTDFF